MRYFGGWGGEIILLSLHPRERAKPNLKYIPPCCFLRPRASRSLHVAKTLHSANHAFQYHYSRVAPEIHSIWCTPWLDAQRRSSFDATPLTFLFSSAYEATVPAGRQALIKTDLSIAIPPNTYARIAPRSGLAVKKMIDVGAGVVDYDYRGPVGVVLFNHGSEDFKVNKGDRVAQLILERICMADIEEVCNVQRACLHFFECPCTSTSTSKPLKE